MEKVTLSENGVEVVIEVSEEVAGMVRDESRIFTRERQNKANRGEVSLSQAMEDGFDYKDEKASFEDRMADRDEMKRALSHLNIEQRRIVYLVFVAGYSRKEVALKFGITQPAMTERINVIKKILKNFLN